LLNSFLSDLTFSHPVLTSALGSIVHQRSADTVPGGHFALAVERYGGLED